METYYVSCKKNILLTKIQVPEKLTEKDLCLYQIVLFVARKNQPTFKVKNSTILIIF